MAFQVTGDVTTVTTGENPNGTFYVRCRNTLRGTERENGFVREADALGYFQDMANTYAPDKPITRTDS